MLRRETSIVDEWIRFINEAMEQNLYLYFTISSLLGQANLHSSILRSARSSLREYILKI